MKGNGIKIENIGGSEAVSELVGVILMISLVIVGVAMVGVFVLGQSTPTEIPSLSMIPSTNDTDLFLYHAGGDSLSRNGFVVRVDGEDYGPDNVILINQDGSTDDDWDSWDLGETLDIPGKSDYSQILLISTRGGQQSVITGSGEGGTFTPSLVAKFTGSPTSGSAPLVVSFSDLSTGSPDSWSWSFGDGGTSNDPNPDHTYAAGGTYTVTLTVSNADGSDTEIKPGYINVSGVTPLPPVANFTADPINGSAPLTVYFTDLSTGVIDNWLWDFGDGGTSIDQNPVHIYSSSGIYTVSLTVSNSYDSDTESKTDYINVSISPPVANFTADPVSGYLPLEVTFTDLSVGNSTSWLWDFGDNSTSTDANPTHIYSSSGSYNVTLTSCNNGGCDSITKTDYISVFGFADYVVNESVFVFGNTLYLSGGDTIIGEGSTIIITGDVLSNTLSGGTTVSVSNIYIDGPVTLGNGGIAIGSSTVPGGIYANGDLNLWSGTQDIYGDVYVNGDLDLKNTHIHGGDVYVNGDLALGWTPTFDSSTRIYYTGSFTHPGSMSSSITDKCIQQSSVPSFEMPEIELPPAKPAEWYDSMGYVSGGDLADNKKIFASSYSTYADWNDGGENVIIVANDGDITLNGFWETMVTGVLFAPNGKVTFNGGSFEGVVIAKDGFYVTSGGTTVVFRNLEDYISDPAEYPF